MPRAELEADIAIDADRLKAERFVQGALPVTERLVNEILTLPLSAGHTEDEIDAVVDAVRSFFGA